MIKIAVTENEIKINGHSNNELCSRVSTLLQFYIAIENENKIKKTEIRNGYTLIEFNEKPNTKAYKKLLECFEDLKNMYPRTLILEM